MKDIAVFGAYNRYNYGDLLFPIVFCKYLESCNQDVLKRLDFYSLTPADLINVGGIRCKGLQEFYSNRDKYKYLIVIGGEVLSATWKGLYFDQTKIPWFVRKVMSRILPEGWYRSRFKTTQRFPYIFPEKFFDGLKVLYNSVGGVNLDLKLVSLITNCSYLSVRDDLTYSYFPNDSQLVPDSVLLLSKYYSKSEIDKRKRIILPKKDYFTLQFNLSTWNKKKKEILDNIEKIIRLTSYDIVLVNIGYADNHDDVVAHKRILSELKNTCRVTMYDNTTVFDTVSLIINSKYFIGTSLHGNITAMAYGIPHLCFNHIVKAASFVTTWLKGDNYTSEVCNFFDKIDLDLITSKNLDQNSGLVPLQQKIIDSLQCMLRIVG